MNTKEKISEACKRFSPPWTYSYWDLPRKDRTVTVKIAQYMGDETAPVNTPYEVFLDYLVDNDILPDMPKHTVLVINGKWSDAMVKMSEEKDPHVWNSRGRQIKAWTREYRRLRNWFKWRGPRDWGWVLELELPVLYGDEAPPEIMKLLTNGISRGTSNGKVIKYETEFVFNSRVGHIVRENPKSFDPNVPTWVDGMMRVPRVAKSGQYKIGEEVEPKVRPKGYKGKYWFVVSYRFDWNGRLQHRLFREDGKFCTFGTIKKVV